MLIDLATQAVRALRRIHALNNYPAWSADGRFLYWSALRDHDSALIRVAIPRADRLEIVAREEFGIVRATPDGRAIYYTLVGRDGIRMRMLSADGRPVGSERLAVDDLSAGSFRAWALGNDAIYWKRTNAAGMVELCSKDLRGGPTRVVITMTDDQTTLQPYASRAGSILIERARYQNDLSGVDVE